MWDYAPDGEVYYEKFLAFAKILLENWRALEVSHSLSVVFFTRMYYHTHGNPASGGAASSSPPPSSSAQAQPSASSSYSSSQVGARKDKSVFVPNLHLISVVSLLSPREWICLHIWLPKRSSSTSNRRRRARVKEAWIVLLLDNQILEGVFLLYSMLLHLQWECHHTQAHHQIIFSTEVRDGR